MLCVGRPQILRFSDLSIQGGLFQAVDDGVQQVGTGGVSGVDVVDAAEGVDCGVDRGGDEVDGLGGGLLGWGEGGKCGRCRDGVGPSVGNSVEGADAFGDGAIGFACDIDDFVELQVQIAEVGAHDIPVCLFALQVQFDEVDEDPLEVLGQALRGLELPHIIAGTAL